MEEIINQLKKEFMESVKGQDERLPDAFEQYMHRAVSNLTKGKTNIDNDSLERIIKRMGKELIDSSITWKKKTLITDESYDNILYISMKSYEVAQKIIRNEKVEEDIQVKEKIDKMKEYLKTVEEFNKAEARLLVSEGILDLKFIENPKTDITSLRLGKQIRSKEQSLNKNRRNDNMQKTSEKFLPVGTVVLLKGGKKRLMVTGFLVKEESKDKTWDYSGCLYPEGVLGANQTALFDHEQIETIYHFGLIDEEEQAFKEQLRVLMNESEKSKNIKSE